MRFKMDFSKLPKCGAKPKAKSVRKHPCKHVALRNGRCYYHKGRPIKHGYYSYVNCTQRASMHQFIGAAKKSLMQARGIINEEVA